MESALQNFTYPFALNTEACNTQWLKIQAASMGFKTQQASLSETNHLDHLNEPISDNEVDPTAEVPTKVQTQSTPQSPLSQRHEKLRGSPGFLKATNWSFNPMKTPSAEIAAKRNTPLTHEDSQQTKKKIKKISKEPPATSTRKDQSSINEEEDLAFMLLEKQSKATGKSKNQKSMSEPNK